MAVLGSAQFSRLVTLTTDQAIAEESGVPYVYENVAAMTAGPTPTANGTRVVAQGQVTRDDGAGTPFDWDSSDRSADVDGVLVIARDGTDGSTGAWVRVREPNVVYVAWYGLSTTNDQATATANRIAIQKCIDDNYVTGSQSVQQVHFKFPPGEYRIDNTSIKLLVGRSYRIDGCGHCELTLFDKTTQHASTQDSLSIFQFQSDSTTSWFTQDIVIENMRFDARGDGTRNVCIKAHRDQTVLNNINIDNLHIHHCRFAADSWCIYFWRVGYSIEPMIEHCRFSGSGPFYISAGNSELHAASNMVLRDWRFQGTPKYGACLHVENTRQTTLDNIVLEGSSPTVEEWLNDEDPANQAVTLYIENAGPQPIVIEGLWYEFWGEDLTGMHGIVTSEEAAGNLTPSTIEILGGKIEGTVLHKGGGSTASNSVVLYKNQYFNENRVVTTEGAVTVHFIDGKINQSSWDNELPELQPNVFYKNCWTGRNELFTKVIQTVYEYQGGWLDNQYLQFERRFGNEPGTLRFVQHDPYEGHTIIYRRGNARYNVYNPDQYSGLIGKQLFEFVRFRIPYFADTNDAYWFNLGTPFGSGVRSTAEIVTESQTNRDGWVQAIGGITLDDLTRLGDNLGDPSRADGTFIWVQYSELLCSLNGMVERKRKPTNFTCYLGAWAGLPIGTVIAGDKCIVDRQIASSGTFWTNITPVNPDPAVVAYYLCTASGTSRVINTVTGDTTSGSDQLTNVVATNDEHQLMIGDYIDIVGVTGTKRVMGIDWSTGDCTLDSTADATTTGAAVTNAPPTWITVNH